jgi:hypothetical protein
VLEPAATLVLELVLAATVVLVLELELVLADPSTAVLEVTVPLAVVLEAQLMDLFTAELAATLVDLLTAELAATLAVMLAVMLEEAMATHTRADHRTVFWPRVPVVRYRVTEFKDRLA